jgi:hypothetical protein
VLLIRGGGDPSELFDPDHPQDAATAGVPPASPAPAPPDACSLLTVAEVSAIRGVPAGPGDPSASSASATDCVWPAERAGDQPLLEIAITGDDPDVWAALVASPEFGDVSSIGRTALVQGGRNGQLWVEAGKYIVHIQPTGPLPGGSPTPELQQQLKVLDALSARLR